MSKPTDPKQPNGRDTTIFYECRILQRTQKTVAKQFHMSQARVSQIVKQVSQWRADASPAEGGELERDQSRRLGHWEGKQRIEKFLGWTMAGIVDSQRCQTIVKQREDGAGQVQWKETTVKPPVVSAQLLRQAGKYNDQLLAYDDRPPPPPAARNVPQPLPQEVQAALNWLESVERGIYSAEHADECAAQHYGSTRLIYPRLWAKHDPRPPVSVPACLAVRAVYGRWGVTAEGQAVRIDVGSSLAEPPPHPQPLSREGRGEQPGATGGTPPVLSDATECEPGPASSNGTFGSRPESPLTAGDESYHSDVPGLVETAVGIAGATSIAESGCSKVRADLPASVAREKTGESISAGPVATSPRPPAAQPLTPSPSPARGEGSRRERNEFRSTPPKPARPKRIWYGGHPPLPPTPGPPPIVIPCRFIG